MDATQKKRRRVVAIAHFSMSMVAYYISSFPYHTFSLFIGNLLFGGNYEANCHLWEKLFLILQPQFLIENLLQRPFVLPIPDSIKYHDDIIVIQQIASVPIWSLCFGWVIVKLFNWLNHFPIPAKKVF